MKKLILSAAFLGLGVFGFAQQSAPASKAEMMQKGAHKLQKMKEELNLTDTQVAQFKELYAKKAAEGKQNMDAKKGDRMQKMKENEAEVQKILTPEQFKKFQDMKAKKMAEMKAMHQDKKAADASMVK